MKNYIEPIIWALLILTIVLVFTLNFQLKRNKIIQCIESVGQVQTCKCAFKSCGDARTNDILNAQIKIDEIELEKIKLYKQ